MYNEPTEKELRQLPMLNSTEDIPLGDKIIHMHFFIDNCDWYIVEYEPKDRLFFGYAILGDDYQNADWGYISFDEIREVRTPHGFEIDRELHWQPRKAWEIDRIQASDIAHNNEKENRSN